MRLKNKVALIGGFNVSNSNISRAIALLFAQEGAKIVLTNTMEETAERIRANGGTVLTHQTDLADNREVESLIDAVVTEFGAVDCFIYEAMDPAYWDGDYHDAL